MFRVKLISSNLDIFQTPIKSLILHQYDLNFEHVSWLHSCCDGQNLNHLEAILQVLLGVSNISKFGIISLIALMSEHPEYLRGFLCLTCHEFH